MGKNRKLPEKLYTFQTLLNQERQKLRLQAVAAKGQQQEETFVNTSMSSQSQLKVAFHSEANCGLTNREALYHIYTDSTFFRYEIVLTRDDEERGIQGEKYLLYVSVPRFFL